MLTQSTNVAIWELSLQQSILWYLRKVSLRQGLLLTTESSFDILDKYRKKTPQDQQAEDQSELTDSAYQSQMKSKDEEEGPPFYDPSNLEGCFAFMDAKRKLRMVLSAGDFLGSTSLHQLMTSQPHSPREFDTGPKKDNDLISLLRAQLAEAINLQNKDVIAQLHEVIRCIRQFDNDGYVMTDRYLSIFYED